MNSSFLFFIPFIFFFFQNAQLSAKTLHGILIADTVHDIRSVTVPDILSWQKELKLISNHTRMDLNTKVFQGRDFNKDKITDYLNTLKVEPNDSIIFFFSGHGYRTYQKKSPWPYMTFEYYKPGLDIEWVVNTIRKKKAKFSLVMSDCCNNYMENGLFGSENKNIVIKLKRYLTEKSGYEQLFCNAKGFIVISSCSKGQFSYGSPLGGLYTQCFFASLSKELGEKKPSWKQALRRANGLISSIQRPICEIYKGN